MIELRKINRHFKNGNESNHILKDIDIHIDEGEFIAIMGPSGSGKSTIFNLIERMYDIERGDINTVIKVFLIFHFQSGAQKLVMLCNLIR